MPQLSSWGTCLLTPKDSLAEKFIGNHFVVDDNYG